MPADPLTAWHTVTPKMAEEWLEKFNTKNRGISTDRVIRYSEDMERGKWLVTHQGIAFDVNGELIDGAQRLSAIVLTGLPLRVLVTRGLSPDVRAVVDQGKARSIQDGIALDGGPKIPREAVSVARHVLMAPGFVVVPVWSPGMVRDAVNLNHDLIARVCGEAAGASVKMRGRTVLLALMARALQRGSIEKIRHFAHVLSTGEGTGSKTETQIIKLRDWIRESADARKPGIAGPRGIYQKAQVVLASFLIGESAEKLPRSTTEDLFVLDAKRRPDWLNEFLVRFGMRNKIETAEHLKRFDPEKRRENGDQ